MEFHVYENARAACEAAGVLIAAQITRKGDSVVWRPARPRFRHMKCWCSGTTAA